MHQRGSEGGRPRALRQAHRRPAARPLDGALDRDAAQPAAERGGARPHRRRLAPAERLGGEAVTIPGGGRVADDVLSFARTNNVTHIVIGKSSRSRWFELLHGSVVHELVRSGGTISVHVIAGEELATEPFPRRPCARPVSFRHRCSPLRDRLIAVAVALGVGKFVQPVLGSRPSILFSLPWSRRGSLRTRPSIVASIAASLATTFFSFRHSTRSPSPRRPTSRRFCSFWSSPYSSPISPRGSVLRPSRHGHGAHDRAALCLQPQARGRRHARRSAVGHRLPNRIDAKIARRPAPARERLDRRQGRVPAGRHAGRGGPRRGDLGMGA